MKQTLLTGILIMLLVMLTGGAAFAQEGAIDFAAERNQFAFSLGPYFPNDEMDDEFDVDWETGGDITMTYTRLIGRYFAVEAGLHAYSTTFDEGALEGELTSSGIEVLFLYTPIHGRVMPYIGGGLGSYANTLEVDFGNIKVVDDEGTGSGLVLKGGVRAHMTQRFFLGGFIKVFANNQEFEYENGDKETINLGGSSVNFEVGFAF